MDSYTTECFFRDPGEFVITQNDTCYNTEHS